MRHARGEQADAAQFIRLHQALLQLGAVGNVVENDQAADLLLVFRNQRRNGEIERGFAVCAAGSPSRWSGRCH